MTGLRTKKDEIFFDSYPGLKIEAIRSENLLHIRNFNPNTSDEIINISFPFDNFSDEALKAEARAHKIVAELSHSLGVDVWSGYAPHWVNFGTQEWQPQDNRSRTPDDKKNIDDPLSSQPSPKIDTFALGLRFFLMIALFLIIVECQSRSSRDNNSIPSHILDSMHEQKNKQ